MEKVEARALSLKSYMRLFLYLSIFTCFINWIFMLFSFFPFFNFRLFVNMRALPTGWSVLFQLLLFPIFTIIMSQVSSFISYWPYRLISKIFNHKEISYIPLDPYAVRENTGAVTQRQITPDERHQSDFNERERVIKVKEMKKNDFLISADDPRYQAMKKNRR